MTGGSEHRRSGHTALGVPKVHLDAGVGAPAGDRRIPHLLQRPALEVHGQRKGQSDDGHDGNQSSQQNSPLPRPPQEAHEEEAYRDLAERGADEIPRLPNDKELHGSCRIGCSALENAKDGPEQCYYLVPQVRYRPPRGPHVVGPTHCGRPAGVVVDAKPAVDPAPDVEANEGGRQGKARGGEREGEKDRPSGEVG